MILVKYDKRNDLKPYFYFALEEYILNNLLKKDEIFFFQWVIEGIVIGKNQIIENEINLDFVRKNKIDVFRRPTGGGCVYNDSGTLIFSIIVKKQDKNFNFKKYLSKIVEAFEKIGINLCLSARNDILLGDKKVSGNAFLQNKNGIIIHGTILYNCNVDTMVRCITPDQEKLISKGIQSVSSRIVNLQQHLKGMTKAELSAYLNNYLTNKQYILNNQETNEIEELSKKYSSSEWILGEHPQYNKKLKKHFDWGCLEILLSLSKGKIEKMFLKGDFFHKKDNSLEFLAQFENIPYTQRSLREISKKIDISDYILNSNNKDFFDLLETGILDL
ncbi:lipoate-protein ligase A [Candidatus Phytoplasma luffae]|uniref:lipoate--protein ligase n=1 Tax=Loofah witches'-broom phytoplasma TaxID=35773 RepID=A0A975FIL7_LOWBP|nr:lipoate--protein ligase [Candidatus Phytoplasma luffae]QTX02593.1 lipoate-protein ligase A [Candidatus Phytoplasma luffae]